MLYKDQVYQIIGAAMEVYNELGPGFLEAVYQEAMQLELELRDIPFKAYAPIPIYYKENKLNKEYSADLLCYEEIIVELKALEQLKKSIQAQVLNYLHGSKNRLGLLINFGHPEFLEWKRIIL